MLHVPRLDLSSMISDLSPREEDEAVENVCQAAIIATSDAAVRAGAATGELKQSREDPRYLYDKLVSDAAVAEETAGVCDASLNVRQSVEKLQASTHESLERLDSRLKQVVADVAHERRLRESAMDCLNRKLETMLGALDPTGVANSADVNLHLSENRDERDVPASFAQLLPVKEMSERLERVEHDMMRRTDDLGAAILADSKRLDEHGARLDNQCESLTLQAECVSAAIDRILQWIGEGDSSGFAAVVEKLASIGDKLSDADTKPETSERSSQMSRQSVRSLADALGAARDWKAISSANSNSSGVIASNAPTTSPVSLPRAVPITSASACAQQNSRPAMPPSPLIQQRAKSLSPSPPRVLSRSPKVCNSPNVYRREASVLSRQASKSPTRSLSVGSEIKLGSSQRVARSRSPTPVEFRNSQIVHVFRATGQEQQLLSPQRDLPANASNLTSSRASCQAQCARSSSSLDIAHGTVSVRRHIFSHTLADRSSAVIPLQASTFLAAVESAPRSISPQRALTPELAGARATARDRARPFRRLVSRSIGIGSDL